MTRVVHKDATLILTRKNRVIGVEISLVYMPEEEPECRWQNQCTHGNCVGHRTRKLGESFVSVPWEWCEDCREAYERLTATDQTATLARTPGRDTDDDHQTTD